MITLLSGSLLLSVLHAILPNHWLPVLAISKSEKWSLRETTRVTLLAGSAHAASTIILGFAIAFAGAELTERWRIFSTWIAPGLLIALGLFFVYQHNRHHHFHLHGNPELVSKNKLIGSLVITMFLSPCFEIEAYFLIAGSMGFSVTLLVAFIYFFITVTGMMIWIRFAYRGITRFNWHSIEHNAGIITGVMLMVTGVLSIWLR